MESKILSMVLRPHNWHEKTVLKEMLKDLLRDRSSQARSIQITPDAYGIELMIVRLKENKASNKMEPEILERFEFCHPNQIKIFFDSAMWIGTKKMELRARGIDLKDCRAVVMEIKGTKRPQWLFDRISKQGVIAL